MAVVVVYGGGFQPFHAGHLSSYLEAKQEFPYANFYVAASNDTKTRPIPFNDKKFLAQQAGVTDKFTEVKLPIRPTEILDRYNPNKDVFILVRSERDPVAYTKKDGTPGYYQPYVDIDDCEPMGQHGYVFVTHKKDFKLNGHDVYSGTQVRDMYANADDKGRQQIIQQLYPQSNQQDTIKQMLDKYLSSTTEPIVAPAKSAIKKLKTNKLKEHIQRMRPLLREANNEQKLKLLKLIKVALKEHIMEEEQVDEAKIHFTDPSIKVNLYYVPPKLEAQGQVQNVAHNIPYSTVEPLINRLLQKYPNMNPDYMVWYPLGQDKYGERIEENQDYLEEK
jgi:hypothetical protein